MMLFRKYSVSILNREWETIESVVRVKHIPRTSEIIHLSDGKYYRVLNVVHNILNKHGIFLIVELLAQKPQDTNNQ